MKNKQVIDMVKKVQQDYIYLKENLVFMERLLDMEII